MGSMCQQTENERDVDSGGSSPDHVGNTHDLSLCSHLYIVII